MLLVLFCDVIERLRDVEKDEIDRGEERGEGESQQLPPLLSDVKNLAWSERIKAKQLIQV